MTAMMRLYLSRLLVLAFLLVDASQAGQSPIKPERIPAYQPKFYPFEAGEKAVYRASWNGLVSVATAEIFTTPKVVDGKNVYEVRIEARTTKFLDLIWKMRDTIRSTFAADDLEPVHFRFNQRENSRIIDTEARYDAGAKQWVVHRQQVGKRTKKYQFDSDNTLDPITAVYMARSVDYQVGDRLLFNVFGGRYRYRLELFVDRKEPVTLASGQTIEAYKILPRVTNLMKKGYARRLNDAVVWISADERRVPIKLQSKITFGSVYLELLQDRHGQRSTSATPGKKSS